MEINYIHFNIPLLYIYNLNFQIYHKILLYLDIDTFLKCLFQFLVILNIYFF